MNLNYEPKTNRFGSRMITPIKQFVVFITGWLGFQVLATIVMSIVTLIFAKSYGLSVDDASNVFELNISFLTHAIAYCSLLVILLLITNIDFIKLAKSFKQYQSYIAGVVCVLAIFAFNFLYGGFIELVRSSELPDNANEATIQGITDVFPVACIFIFGFIGPICEELTYRVGLFSALKRKSTILAYVVTIIFFAFIHFDFNFKNADIVTELLNMPYYLFAAFAFCFTFDHYGFAGSATAHIINNLFSLIAPLILHE